MLDEGMARKTVLLTETMVFSIQNIRIFILFWQLTEPDCITIQYSLSKR